MYKNLISKMHIQFYKNQKPYIKNWKNVYKKEKNINILLLMHHHHISEHYHYIYIALSRHFEKVNVEISKYILQQAIRKNVYKTKKIKSEYERINEYKGQKLSECKLFRILRPKSIYLWGREWVKTEEVVVNACNGMSENEIFVKKMKENSKENANQSERSQISGTIFSDLKQQSNSSNESLCGMQDFTVFRNNKVHSLDHAEPIEHTCRLGNAHTDTLKTGTISRTYNLRECDYNADAQTELAVPESIDFEITHKIRVIGETDIVACPPKKHSDTDSYFTPRSLSFTDQLCEKSCNTLIEETNEMESYSDFAIYDNTNLNSCQLSKNSEVDLRLNSTYSRQKHIDIVFQNTTNLMQCNQNSINICIKGKNKLKHKQPCKCIIEKKISSLEKYIEAVKNHAYAKTTCYSANATDLHNIYTEQQQINLSEDGNHALQGPNQMSGYKLKDPIVSIQERSKRLCLPYNPEDVYETRTVKDMSSVVEEIQEHPLDLFQTKDLTHYKKDAPEIHSSIINDEVIKIQEHRNLINIKGCIKEGNCFQADKWTFYVQKQVYDFYIVFLVSKEDVTLKCSKYILRKIDQHGDKHNYSSLWKDSKCQSQFTLKDLFKHTDEIYGLYKYESIISIEDILNKCLHKLWDYKEEFCVYLCYKIYQAQYKKGKLQSCDPRKLNASKNVFLTLQCIIMSFDDDFDGILNKVKDEIRLEEFQYCKENHSKDILRRLKADIDKMDIKRIVSKLKMLIYEDGI